MKKRFTPEEIRKLADENRLDIFYNSKAWRELSHEVIREQNRECQLCKRRGKYSPAVIAHHVKPLKERPDLAYSRTYTDARGAEQRQLIAVCFRCHEAEHGRSFSGSVRPSKKFRNEEKF